MDTFPLFPESLLESTSLRSYCRRVLDALKASLDSDGNCLVLPPPVGEPPCNWGYFHLRPELFIQCSGSTLFHFPDGSSLTLGPGEILTLPPFLAHQETIIDEKSFAKLVFGFGPQGLSFHLAMASEKPLDHKVVATLQISHPLAIAVRHAMEGLSIVSSPETSRLWGKTFVQTMRELLEQSQQTQGNNDEHDRISRCRSLVETYISRPDLNVAMLAQWLNCHPNHLGQSFRRVMGRTLISWITETRISRAKEILLSTNLSIHAVAAAVGYHRTNYFSRVFREKTQCSPQEWRSGGGAEE